jgi:hypothetical protein
MNILLIFFVVFSMLMTIQLFENLWISVNPLQKSLLYEDRFMNLK